MTAVVWGSWVSVWCGAPVAVTVGKQVAVAGITERQLSACPPPTSTSTALRDPTPPLLTSPPSPSKGDVTSWRSTNMISLVHRWGGEGRGGGGRGGGERGRGGRGSVSHLLEGLHSGLYVLSAPFNPNHILVGVFSYTNNLLNRQQTSQFSTAYMLVCFPK